MGHTLDETRAAYFRAAPEKLREIYAKYIPYLTITKENSIEENPEFKKLNEEIQRLKGENEKLKLDRFENEAIKKLKEDLKELRKAQKEKEELEIVFSDIVAGEFSELNRHEDWEEKYNRHWEKMRTDLIYRKKFNEFELPFILETFGNGQGREVEEHNKKEREEHKKLRDAEDKLYSAITNTKTLSENL